VTLGGQRLDADGRWTGRPQRTVIAPGSGSYEVPLPAFSAALMTANIAPGALS